MTSPLFSVNGNMTLPLKYVWYRKAVDLRLQIEALKAAALEAYTEKTEKTDSDVSDEVDQGLHRPEPRHQKIHLRKKWVFSAN